MHISHKVEWTESILQVNDSIYIHNIDMYIAYGYFYVCNILFIDSYGTM